MADTDDTTTDNDAQGDDTAADTNTGSGDSGSTDDDTPLGPKGEKALEAIKEERRQLKAELAKRDADLAELRRSQMDDHERAIEEAKDEARAEALGSVNGRLFVSELKAAAAPALLPAATKDLLVDPAVALKLLGFDGYPVTSDGDIDSEAISQAVTAYVAERPHLASAPPPPGSIDQGARTTPTPKDLDSRIREAEVAGDIQTSLALKAQKLSALPRP